MHRLSLVMKRVCRGWLLSASLLIGGCHSAGPYGYSQHYEPLSEEEDAARTAREYDPVMAERFAEEWQGQPVSIFGIVTQRRPGPNGTTDVALSVRTLAERNLCDEGGEQTCRVTVSEREHGIVHALVRLKSEDNIGAQSVGRGSLLRVIAVRVDDVNADDGAPIFRAKYYRHWPRNFYVTTAARGYMRR